jgi:hypothetical protein
VFHFAAKEWNAAAIVEDCYASWSAPAEEIAERNPTVLGAVEGTLRVVALSGLDRGGDGPTR